MSPVKCESRRGPMKQPPWRSSKEHAKAVKVEVN